MSWQYIFCAAIVVGMTAGFILLYYHTKRTSKQVIREVQRQCDNVILQLECLININVEISPIRALPRSRGWAASPDFLHQVIECARRIKPPVIFECSSGLSTVVLAGCLRNIGEGHVYSLEHDPHYAERTREVLRMQGLDLYATIVDAPLKEVTLGAWRGRWYDLTKLPELLEADLLVIDGPPFDSGSPARYPALPCLYQRLSSRCTIILDDAARADEKQAVSMWLKEFPGLHVVQSNGCEKGCAVLERRS